MIFLLYFILKYTFNILCFVTIYLFSDPHFFIVGVNALIMYCNSFYSEFYFINFVDILLLDFLFLFFILLKC